MTMCIFSPSFSDGFADFSSFGNFNTAPSQPFPPAQPAHPLPQQPPQQQLPVQNSVTSAAFLSSSKSKLSCGQLIDWLDRFSIVHTKSKLGFDLKINTFDRRVYKDVLFLMLQDVQQDMHTSE